MKRPWLILAAGLALASAAYFGVYRATYSSCCPAPATASELGWLKNEFHLSDAAFQRISELHNAYLPACRERCAAIDAKTAEARALLARSGAVTPEVERALADAARLRGECQAAMLRHFIEVSRAMPPEQGRRYLDWICARAFPPQHDTMAPAGSAHDHHAM